MTMNFRQYFTFPTKALMLSSTVLFIAGCGSSSSDSTPTSNNGGHDVPSSTKLPIVPNMVSLVYNGFSASADKYTIPSQLAGDLSATQAANLYLNYLYTKAVGKKDAPPPTLPQNHNITLPVSKISTHTNPTVLDPKLAMTSQDPGIAAWSGKLTPSAINPVMLSVFIGRENIPETPFFPQGTRYTAVFMERPAEAKHGAIISIEASPSNPVIFGAFGHDPKSSLNLRFYDAHSTIDSTNPQAPLLSKTTTPGVIKARFLSLTSDNLPSMSLQSMDRQTFADLGLTARDLLTVMAPVFPGLIDVKGTTPQTMFNENHGIFCLGGKNTFVNVDLAHQTFVYPMSSSDTNITTMNVSADSGFIVESGKHINVQTLKGNKTLKLITVTNDVPSSTPIVHVETLNNVDTINVVVGKVTSGSKLPTAGMVLLSHDNAIPALTVRTEDAHMNGVFYDGEAKYEDKKVILTSLTPKSRLSAGIVQDLLARHPSTQGASTRVMHQLIAALNPIQLIHHRTGGFSAAHMHHLSQLYLNVSKLPLATRLEILGSNTVSHNVISTNLSHTLGNLAFTTSIYGVVNNLHETAFGATITAFSHITFANNLLIPSATIGYTSNRLGNIDLRADNISVQLNDINLSSLFARLMTTFNHVQNDNLSASIAAGIEACYSKFNRGVAVSDHLSFSVKDQQLNSIHSIVETKLTSKSASLRMAIWNFNQFDIQFSFID
jgi:hypothetical protein